MAVLDHVPQFPCVAIFTITLRKLISFSLIIITLHLVDGWEKDMIEEQSVNTEIAFWQAPHSFNKWIIPKQQRYCN